MDPPPITATVAGRFVSESALDAAKAVRTEEWRLMHEKLGQPVPQMEDSKEPYDGRSLWEKLKEHKDVKQNAIDEQLKFKNQFRALDEDEISFLDSLVDDNNEEDLKSAQEVKNQLATFRQAVVARLALPPPPILSTSPIASTSTLLSPSSATSTVSPSLSSSSNSLPTTSITGPTIASTTTKKSKKKDFQKSFLSGVVIKKKSSVDKTGSKRRASESNEVSGEMEGGEEKKQKI